MKYLVAIGVSAATIGILWLSSSSGNNDLSARIVQTDPPPSAKAASAAASSKPKPSSIPTTTPSTAVLVPQQLVTITPSSTPTPTPTRTPTAKPTLPVVSPTSTPSNVVATIPTPTPTRTPTATLTATPTSDLLLDLKVLSLTSPIAQKQTANIQIETSPGANCTIKLTLPSGTVSTSKDLSPKTADTEGKITWSWSVSWNTKPGTAHIELTCTLGNQKTSGQVTMEIIPAPTATP